MQTIAERLETLPQIGRLEWIGLSTASGQPLTEVQTAVLLAGHGLEGDRHAKRQAGSKRQVTLIQQEHLPVIAACVHRDAVSAQQLRRNLVVSGINLLALKNRQFRIGGCLLEHTGPCDPCSKMEQTLGPGGLNAMRGHGGITAAVLEGGVIRIGDDVQFVGMEE